MDDNTLLIKLQPMYWYNARTGLGGVAAILLLRCQPQGEQQQPAGSEQRCQQPAKESANG
ncbi:hypothetical protein [Pseudomonas sp.]|uniref:hypothetical protein n=1 Tax=Pseudomonas sp. TaxID=306 RepID=UPI003D1274C4